MYKVITCKTHGGLELLTRNDESVKPTLLQLHELVDGYIEIVRPIGLPSPYIMVVDEEGGIKDNPQVNLIGTILYHSDNFKLTSISLADGVSAGTMEFEGSPIFGNIVILKETEDKQDFVGLEIEDVQKIVALIENLAKF